MSFETTKGRGKVTRSSEPEVLSVSDLNKAIRSTLEGGFPLLWLKGELSNFKPHSSGHWYFSLKDSKAQVSAVMFRGFNQSVRFRPSDGQEVLVRGKVTVYEPRGNYQIFCELMEPVGAGALQLAFEKLKNQLQAEGLFDAAKKRPLPPLPKHVAVVTSATGAAFRDILNVLSRRFRGLRITLVPAIVQGEQAAKSIVSALALAYQLKDVDAIIVGRGGGSQEDLWCFNDEKVVRMIALSPVPTISAVGHEIDFTISDFVADVRAPTPSAAAELVVQSAEELSEKFRILGLHLARVQKHNLVFYLQRLETLRARLVDPKRRLQDLGLRVDDLADRLQLAQRNQMSALTGRLTLLEHRLGSPEVIIREKRQSVNEWRMRLEARIEMSLERERARLAKGAALLDSFSPLKVIDRGYAIVTDAKSAKVVRHADQMKNGDLIQIRLTDGQISAEVKGRI